MCFIPRQNGRKVGHRMAQTHTFVSTASLPNSLELRPFLSHTKCIRTRSLGSDQKMCCGDAKRQRHTGCVPYLAHWQAPVPYVRGSPTLMCWPAGPRMRSGIVVALPLTAVSSQFVIGSFEARFFAQTNAEGQSFLPAIFVHYNWQVGLSALRRVRRDCGALPRRRPGCDPRRRFCARCAGRALSPSRS
jgi:hypothetical protein